jgi:hypothetical protein
LSIGETVKIEKFAEYHVNDVAYLHSKLMPYSLNSLMGSSRILNLYSKSLVNPAFIGFVAVTDEKVSAFITATSNYKKSAKFGIRTINFGDLKTLILFHNPLKTLLTILDTFEISFRVRGIANESFYLTSWGSDSRFGINSGGGQVFLKMLQSAKDSAQPNILADIRKSNTSVLAMYKNIGFKPYAKTILSEILIKTP